MSYASKSAGETFTEECAYCHIENDCLVNESGKFMCSDCYELEMDATMEKEKIALDEYNNQNNH